jgi:hypothetical protein
MTKAKSILALSLFLPSTILLTSSLNDTNVDFISYNESQYECSSPYNTPHEATIACSTTATSSSQPNRFSGTVLLEQILASDYDAIDPAILSNSIKALKNRGAHRCWHKHSTFLDHLLGVHNILRLWGQGAIIGRVGLFHSAYSNSYVNLALFDPSSEREMMQQLIGNDAEELVHLFCTIDRQAIVVNTLLRQGYIPKDGLFVPHLRYPNETIFLSSETLRLLVVFSMADTADQYFGWQDSLFGGGGIDGSMIIPGLDFPERHNTKALWPGISKPGLWMNYVSGLGQLVRTFDPSWKLLAQNNVTVDWADKIDFDSIKQHEVPPIFNNGRETISVRDEIEARDMYWRVVTGDVVDDNDVLSTLLACCEKNPWVFEPLVMLAQVYLHRNEYESAAKAASRALDLQSQWGTAWDKRLSFGAWLSWTRVIFQRATRREPWPTNSWEVNNFGFVQ